MRTNPQVPPGKTPNEPRDPSTTHLPESSRCVPSVAIPPAADGTFFFFPCSEPVNPGRWNDCPRKASLPTPVRWPLCDGPCAMTERKKRAWPLNSSQAPEEIASCTTDSKNQDCANTAKRIKSKTAATASSTAPVRIFLETFGFFPLESCIVIPSLTRPTSQFDCLSF